MIQLTLLHFGWFRLNRFAFWVRLGFPTEYNPLPFLALSANRPLCNTANEMLILRRFADKSPLDALIAFFCDLWSWRQHLRAEMVTNDSMLTNWGTTSVFLVWVFSFWHLTRSSGNKFPPWKKRNGGNHMVWCEENTFPSATQETWGGLFLELLV